MLPIASDTGLAICALIAGCMLGAGSTGAPAEVEAPSSPLPFGLRSRLAGRTFAQCSAPATWAAIWASPDGTGGFVCTASLPQLAPLILLLPANMLRKNLVTRLKLLLSLLSAPSSFTHAAASVLTATWSALGVLGDDGLASFNDGMLGMLPKLHVDASSSMPTRAGAWAARMLLSAQAGLMCCVGVVAAPTLACCSGRLLLVPLWQATAGDRRWAHKGRAGHLHAHKQAS